MFYPLVDVKNDVVKQRARCFMEPLRKTRSRNIQCNVASPAHGRKDIVGDRSS